MTDGTEMGDAPTPLVTGAVVSVNVGAPRAVEWAGRQVTTGIWKAPVSGRVPVTIENLRGDAQADRRVHGGPDKAVYAYAREDYRWWEGQLGRVLEPGTFGENLTTEGIDLARAVVGERWVVGSAHLRVTQPRMPCFKLGIRMGDADFIRAFGEARRLGVYLGVDAGGDIGTGDPVVVVGRPVHGLTATAIADIEATKQPDQLRRLRDTPGVPVNWTTWAERQLRRLGAPEGEPQAGEQEAGEPEQADPRD